jgi:hypothetical protein
LLHPILPVTTPPGDSPFLEDNNHRVQRLYSLKTDRQIELKLGVVPKASGTRSRGNRNSPSF